MERKNRNSKTPADFERLNAGKESFDEIYNLPDPRQFLATLGRLDYVISKKAKPVFRSVIDDISRHRKIDKVTILDIGCSYGINAALLKYNMGIDELCDRWGQSAAGGVGPAAGWRFDQRCSDLSKSAAPIEVIGLDPAQNAINFGLSTGLLDQGFTDNLEQGSPSLDLAKALSWVDLVISTGSIGYLGAKTFERLLKARDPSHPLPWVASFVLRMFPYDAIEATLADAGLVTEKLQGMSFRQRRFATEKEQKKIIDSLTGLGIDPAGKEADGYLHAEFFLSRPASEIAGRPLGTLLSKGFGSN